MPEEVVVATITLFNGREALQAEIVSTEEHPKHGTIKLAACDVPGHGRQVLAFRQGKQQGWYEFPHPESFFYGYARLYMQ